MREHGRSRGPRRHKPERCAVELHHPRAGVKCSAVLHLRCDGVGAALPLHDFTLPLLGSAMLRGSPMAWHAQLRRDDWRNHYPAEASGWPEGVAGPGERATNLRQAWAEAQMLSAWAVPLHSALSPAQLTARSEGAGLARREPSIAAKQNASPAHISLNSARLQTTRSTRSSAMSASGVEPGYRAHHYFPPLIPVSSTLPSYNNTRPTVVQRMETHREHRRQRLGAVRLGLCLLPAAAQRPERKPQRPHTCLRRHAPFAVTHPRVTSERAGFP